MPAHLRPRALAAGLVALATVSVLPAVTASAAPSTADSGWTRATGPMPRDIYKGRPGDGNQTVVLPVNRRGRSLSTGAQYDKVSDTAFTPRLLSTTELSTINVTYDAGFQANPSAMAAFERAVVTWEHAVASPVPIDVDASMASLGTGVLGGAGPAGFYKNNGLFYPAALAEALNGAALESGPEILAQFGNQANIFYFGADPAAIPANQYDFESVVLHELGHGLGFLGSVQQLNDGRVVQGFSSEDPSPLVYDIFTQAANGTSILDYPSLSTQLKAAVTSGSVHWNGSEGAGADRGRMPRLYAPNPFEQGSSYSHVDDNAYAMGDADSLMTPFADAGDITRDPGEITLGMFRDMGWVTPGLPGNRYTALPTSAKVLDTGSGLPSNHIVEIKIAGASGVPANATSAVINLTVGPPASAASTVRAYPRPRIESAPLPAVGNVITRVGETRDGLVTVGIDRRTGRVRFHNSGGAARIVANLVGYYAPDATTVDTDFHPSTAPVRVMDTRNGTGVRAGLVGQGGVVELTVTGSNGVPLTATSVVLTVTAVAPSTNGYVSTYPTGITPPAATLHTRHNETGNNQVLVRVGTGGRIRFRNGTGSTHLIADLSGWFEPSSTTGYLYRPSLPQRLLTVRLAGRSVRDALVSTDSSSYITGVPTTAQAALLTLSGGSATGATGFQVYPSAAAVPATTNLNIVVGQTAINQVTTGMSSGRVRVRNASSNTSLLATAYLDLFGWYGVA